MWQKTRITIKKKIIIIIRTIKRITRITIITTTKIKIITIVITITIITIWILTRKIITIRRTIIITAIK